MHEDDIIEIQSQLTQIVSLLTEIKFLLKDEKTQRESKLPRQI